MEWLHPWGMHILSLSVTTNVKFYFMFQERSSITLTEGVILEIQKGLRLGELLSLPNELQFTASRMSSLLFPRDQMRPLLHIWLVYWHKVVVSIFQKYATSCLPCCRICSNMLCTCVYIVYWSCYKLSQHAATVLNTLMQFLVFGVYLKM